MITNIGKNESGKRYGRLLVISASENDKFGNKRWTCLCDCGNEKIVVGMNLRKGLIQSCGCLRKEVSKKIMTILNFKHGLSRSKEYKTHYSTKHTMAKRRQVPPWADEEKIKEIYLNRPKGFHVDHIVPLQGKLVSGLHVENNLQYLPAKVNIAKHNFYEV
jgi:hypothetical protein